MDNTHLKRNDQVYVQSLTKVNPSFWGVIRDVIILAVAALLFGTGLVVGG